MNKPVLTKYFNNDMPRIEQKAEGDWIDLYVNEIIPMESGLLDPVIRHNADGSWDVDPVLPEIYTVKILFGIGMELPEGKEAHILPRSSTFKNYGMILVNGMGVIDNSFNGPKDQWFSNWICFRPFEMDEFARIAQFSIVDKMEQYDFHRSDLEHNMSRGGEGSTGKTGYIFTDSKERLTL